ncbi:hypothetical protein Scep_003068 [Stephania cephalantha]|uniref:ZF-HD dimerization-type domain-containing protein n=1 Tax=Stephania cephalantha TaxID=152367 RepID=A0AAP0KS78_9MAGN
MRPHRDEGDHDDQERRRYKGWSNGNYNNKEKQQAAEAGLQVRYRECRKNHAANIGGYAVDGCREFMAAGAEGTSAAFKCAACNCHRNFHKREVVDYEDCSSISTTTTTTSSAK